MCEDPYTYSQPITVGGGPGTYIAECPFSGDEYEWCLLSAANGPQLGQVFISDTDPRTIDVPYDGSVAYGSYATAPRTFLNGIPIRMAINSSVLNTPVWFRVPTGSKNLFVYINATAGTSIYVTFAFRFLPVRIIPPRTLTVPSEAETQHNILREQKAIDRLQMDIKKGDKDTAPYGHLQ